MSYTRRWDAPAARPTAASRRCASALAAGGGGGEHGEHCDHGDHDYGLSPAHVQHSPMAAAPPAEPQPLYDPRESLRHAESGMLLARALDLLGLPRGLLGSVSRSDVVSAWAAASAPWNPDRFVACDMAQYARALSVYAELSDARDLVLESLPGVPPRLSAGEWRGPGERAALALALGAAAEPAAGAGGGWRHRAKPRRTAAPAWRADRGTAFPAEPLETALPPAALQRDLRRRRPAVVASPSAAPPRHTDVLMTTRAPAADESWEHGAVGWVPLSADASADSTWTLKPPPCGASRYDKVGHALLRTAAVGAGQRAADERAAQDQPRPHWARPAPAAPRRTTRSAVFYAA